MPHPLLFSLLEHGLSLLLPLLVLSEAIILKDLDKVLCVFRLEDEDFVLVEDLRVEHRVKLLFEHNCSLVFLLDLSDASGFVCQRISVDVLLIDIS